MHEKSLTKIDKLNDEIKHLNGKIRDLKNRVFGKKSEKKSSSKKDGKSKDKGSGKKRKRGQQPGTKGHGRTKRPDLSRVEEHVHFPEDRPRKQSRLISFYSHNFNKI